MRKTTYTFDKNCRLKSKKTIQQLFEKGEGFTCYPWRITYTRSDAEQKTKVLFSVPKKRFKRAVDRNRFKRLMREAYRLNCHLLEGKNMGLNVAFVSIIDTIPSYDFVEKKMREVIGELSEKK